ncbi:GNAT family N-acetyltransferase [Actinoplanes sp. NPDC049802]|uniref:GNAT family N-acetyltransferase n=1 Tax=Actinoplanes sp. NPDC049802 TaxID=3154742 RepID=UPI0033C9B606
MDPAWTIRPARPDDAGRMAVVNIRCWQETYRGVMTDAILDEPRLPAFRERFWRAAMTDERYRDNRVAVAERDGDIIGLAMSGPSLPVRHLFVLYVLASDHGTGAGKALLDAVIPPGEPASLWVADPNPRAQAFYRKQGFRPDGTVQVDCGVREIRMVRSGQR